MNLVIRKIADYCKGVAEREPFGWTRFHDYKETSVGYVAMSHPPTACAFICERDGLHMMASIKDFGVLQVIHLSVGPIKYFRPAGETEEELDEFILAAAPHVAYTFFGDREFARQPDDPRKPDVKHFFAILEVNE